MNQELEKTIERCKEKLGTTKENELCRYIPGKDKAGDDKGYIHHFSYRKMKTEDPKTLATLLKEYILDPKVPEKLGHKPRAPRGARKRLEFLNFNKNDMDNLMHLVRVHGDPDMVKKLSPKRDLKSTKKELLASIKAGRVDQDLWDHYADLASSINASDSLNSSFASSMSKD